MKYTIEGFSQEYAMTLKKEVVVGKKTVLKKIDCTDLVILRWFVDFYPNMKKIEVDGKQYAWLTHKKLQQDLPIVDITKRAFIDRMQKLVEFEILDYKLLKEGGTFSLYGFGKNYKNMIRSNGPQSNNTGDAGRTTQGVQSNDTGVVQSNDIGYAGQLHNKDNSIKDSSVIDNSIKIKEIVDFLNDKANKKFKASTDGTKKHINARLNEGFTVDDCKLVIEKKCADWIGTDYEKYLRPSTLFRNENFEGYLNEPAKKKKGAAGVAVSGEEMDEETKKIFGE